MQEILTQMPASFEEYDERKHGTFHPRLFLTLIGMIPFGIANGKIKILDISNISSFSTDLHTGAMMVHKTISAQFEVPDKDMQISLEIMLTTNIATRVTGTIINKGKVISSFDDLYGGLPDLIINFTKYAEYVKTVRSKEGFVAISELLGTPTVPETGQDNSTPVPEVENNTIQ